MHLLKKHGVFIFWLVLLLDSFFIYSEQGLYRFFTKISLVPILVLYIFFNSRNKYHSSSKTLIYVALLFAWIGDILLLNEGTIFFLLGMISFLTTHICFTILFFRIHRLQIKRSQHAFTAGLILFLFSYLLYNFLLPELGNFKIPILIYIIGISSMAIASANLLGSSIRKSAAQMYFLPGAILFILSDTFLALHVFMFSDLAILNISGMLCYGYALNLFAEGFTKLLKG